MHAWTQVFHMPHLTLATALGAGCYCCSHFSEKETEARGPGHMNRSHSEQVAKLGQETQAW